MTMKWTYENLCAVAVVSMLSLFHFFKLSESISTHFYRPQTKFGARYYFNTCLSFCSRGGGWSQGGHGPGGVPGPGGCLVPGALVPWGAGPGGYLVLGGLLQGGCLVETPQMATAAGGTHPTGMHSCLNCYSTENI